MKKFFIGLVAMGVIATNANAWWIQNGDLREINAHDEGLTITVISEAGDQFIYTLDPAHNTKEMYATLLTAFSLGKNVTVEINNALVQRVILAK
jgi:hypothetical protein